MNIQSFDSFKNVYVKQNKPAILFVGPPGSGKGTQSQIIAKELDYLHVSTGDILRKSKDSKIKEMMKTGKLLPDDLLAKVVQDYIEENGDVKGFIFDGYPRNLSQKDHFQEILKNTNLSVKNIIFLDVPEKVLKDRIKERAKTSGRPDDADPKVFQIRMTEYAEQTFPMIESIKTDDGFIEINGKEKLETITKNILKRLK
jgi:adenylate kinase